MARYLLDTNIVSYLVDVPSPFHQATHDALAGLGEEDAVAISVLTLYELHHWFSLRPGDEAVG